MLVAIALITLEIMGLGAEYYQQTKIESETEKAQSVLSHKQKEYENLDAKLSVKQKQQALKNGGYGSLLAKETKTQDEAKETTKTLLTMIFNYGSGNDELAIPQKLKKSQLITDEAIKESGMFNVTPQTKQQLEGANMTCSIDFMNVKTGTVSAKGIVPVFAKVAYEMKKDNSTLGTPTDGYELNYDSNSKKIISIKNIGRFKAQNSED